MVPAESTVDLKLIRAASLLDTNPRLSAQLASEILVSNPSHIDANLLLAGACRRLKEPDKAIPLLRALAAREPYRQDVALELGQTLRLAGLVHEASAILQELTEREPAAAQAWRELSRCQSELGLWSECDRSFLRYYQLVATDAHLEDAVTAIKQRRYDHAEELIRRRLKLAPQDVEALRLLALVFSERENYPEADRLLEECLRLEPGFAQARFDLANSLQQQQRPAPVLPLLDRLLVLDPQNFEFRSLLASTLRILGAVDRAIEIHRQLLREVPTNVNSWLALGHALRADGAIAEAIAAYRKAIELRLGFGEAYYSLANLKTFRFEPNEIIAMREQLAREDINDEDRWHLEFAMGKALEDDADYQASFAHYARGNALRRASVIYDPDATSERVLRARDVYTSQFFSVRAEWGCPAPDPIFIVGLPRSGSTLIEQILASHSEVEGTRELPDIPAIAFELGARKLASGQKGYPETVADLTAAQALSFGIRYIEQTRAYRFGSKARFIDKMPNNFINIGLIHLILPKARIIDVRRHPIASVMANFKQLFHKGLWFSYSLDEIARYYRDYVTLMSHYDKVLPDRVHRVYYEHLVTNPEVEIRQLLEYCSLPFEENCLRFHETKRVVQTVSSEQVRRPMYIDGIDQWRNYEPWLEQVKTQLADLISGYPPAT